jgi:hypothetical protein
MNMERQGTIMLVMFVGLMTALVICGSRVESKPPVKKEAQAVKTQRFSLGAKEMLRVMRTHPGKTKGDVKRYPEFAAHFVTYGRRWKVDPIIVACVAYIESGFKAKPPTLWKTKCIDRLVGNCGRRPGPCYPQWKKVCRRVKRSAGEAGMLQTLWYDKSTREGYKLCTGKKLKGTKAKKKRLLSPPKVAICVGAYELSKWKRWATKGGYGRIRRSQRMTPKSKRNVSFFKRNPSLRKHFWVSFHNWGSNKWVGNGYPRAVLSCFKRFRAGIKQNRSKPKKIASAP